MGRRPLDNTDSTPYSSGIGGSVRYTGFVLRPTTVNQCFYEPSFGGGASAEDRSTRDHVHPHTSSAEPCTTPKPRAHRTHARPIRSECTQTAPACTGERECGYSVMYRVRLSLYWHRESLRPTRTKSNWHGRTLSKTWAGYRGPLLATLPLSPSSPM